MKKVSILLLTLVFILLLANVSMAADDQTVTVNPFGLLFGVFNGVYEKSLGNQNSFLVSGSFLSWELLGDKITGMGAGCGYRAYFGEEDFHGFFGQGTVGVSYVTAPEVSSTAFDVGALVGFKWLYDHGFTVEAGAGAAMVFGELEGYDNFGGFAPALHLSLGYTW